MSALPQHEAAPERVPMTLGDLDPVLALEQAVYPFPWTRGNFIDSLASAHVAHVLRERSGRLAGYSVAMAGVDEMHLLNLTVASALQGRGLARWMLDALVAQCRDGRRAWLWLEVRASNLHARRVYARYGFEEVGLRRGYYPALGQREDAVVMRLAVTPAKGDDALE